MIHYRAVMLMLKIQNLSLSLGFSHQELTEKAAKALKISPSLLREVRLLRQSIDARKKGDIRYICSVYVAAENESKLLAGCGNSNVTVWDPPSYVFPQIGRASCRERV